MLRCSCIQLLLGVPSGFTCWRSDFPGTFMQETSILKGSAVMLGLAASITAVTRVLRLKRAKQDNEFTARRATCAYGKANDSSGIYPRGKALYRPNSNVSYLYCTFNGRKQREFEPPDWWWIHFNDGVGKILPENIFLSLAGEKVCLTFHLLFN